MSTSAQFLALADAGRNAHWRYGLGLVFIMASWLAGGGYAYLLMQRLAPPGEITEFVAVNASIVTLLIAVVAVVVVLHRRSPRTLITPSPSIDWRRMAAGGAVWGALVLLAALGESLLYPGRYQWTADLSRWLPFVAAALVMTPLQCAAEELVFRGYLMQALARVWRQPAFIALTSSVLFTLPHLLNPEVAAYGFWIMAANYLLMGLFFALIALRDGRLELAIGVHTVNNLLLALVVNYADSVFETPSLFTAAAMDPVYSLFSLCLGAVLFYGWFFRRGSSPA